MAILVASFSSLVLGAIAPTFVHSEEANEFTLGITNCDGNTLELSDCMSQGADKADQWLQAIFKSYLRKIETIERSVRNSEFNYDGYSPADKLRKSQEFFEEYRKISAEFAYEKAYPGSIRQLLHPATRYYMTIDRIRDLLDSCGYLDMWDDLPKSVDLNKTDWCERQ